jgi:hypothetical protein
MPSSAILVPLIAVWAYAALELCVLAARRGRRGVRTSAIRARAALIVGVLFAAVAAGVSVWAMNAWAIPLLLLPALVAARLTLPPLARLIRTLYTEPWGPSDPAIRRTAADPAITVPAQATLFGALVAGYASTWVAATVSYALAALASVGLVLLARRLRTELARRRVGTMRRVLVQPRAADDSPETMPDRHPVAA